MPQKETLDRAAYTCMLVSYRRLPPQFQFSLSGVTLVYCISMCGIEGKRGVKRRTEDLRRKREEGKY
jgi:hypothetical protein